MSARAKAAQRAGDGELMRRLADGDLSSLGVLYERHAAALRRFLVRANAGDAASVDDLTQDAFLELVSAARRYDGARAVWPFLMGIAGNLSLRKRRRHAISLRVLERARGWGAEDPATPEHEAALGEDLARCQHALARLSLKKRVTLVLADVEGLSGEEIAEALHIPVNTVWTRLHHARANVRQTLSSRAGGDGAAAR